jgi:hypothetical protein
LVECFVRQILLPIIRENFASMHSSNGFGKFRHVKLLAGARSSERARTFASQCTIAANRLRELRMAVIGDRMAQE